MVVRIVPLLGTPPESRQQTGGKRTSERNIRRTHRRPFIEQNQSITSIKSSFSEHRKSDIGRLSVTSIILLL